jgi:NADH-quinone oxidoreductase subunit H
MKIIPVVLVFLLHLVVAIYAERKVLAHMQARLGPMRVGWHGVLQVIADAIKLIFKEDIIPSQSDKPIFYVAPLIGVLAAVGSIAVIPLWNNYVIADLNLGVLYLLALSSVGAYCIILAGWSSNSKYTFLGGLRSSAQVISYEISMGLSLVGVMMLSGSANLSDIVRAQSNGWYVIPQIVAFFVFVVSAVAETNRTPFDLPEGESELVAGYFTEYSGIRWMLFMMAEYVGMMIMSSIAAVCFLGGWSGPEFWIFAYVPDVVWLILKIYAFMFFYIWLKATLPRYRYDQLMGLGWKLFIPLALANIVLTALIKLL